MYNYLLIDFNNLFWRTVTGTFKSIEDIEREGQSSLVIKNTIDKVNDLITRFGTHDCKCYLLLDNPNSAISARKLISQEYKHARDSVKLPPLFYKLLESVETILQYYSNDFYICKVKNLEADDLVYPIIKSLDFSNDQTALVISVDMDWARAINEKIDWFNWSDIIDIKTFTEKYGFSPVGKTIQMYKAFHGDTSDQIINALPGLPKEILFDIINKYSTIPDLIKDLWKLSYPREWLLKIKEAEIQLKINYRLADYMEFNSSIPMIQCKENIGSLKYWFELYSLPLEPRMVDEEKDDFFQAIPSKVKVIHE